MLWGSREILARICFMKLSKFDESQRLNLQVWLYFNFSKSTFHDIDVSLPARFEHGVIVQEEAVADRQT